MIIRTDCSVAIFFLLIASRAIVAAPASTSAPTSAPTLDGSLANGVVRFAPPAGWEEVSKASNGLMITYASPDKSAFISVGATPQEQPVTDDFKQDMALKIGKGIREQFKKDGREVLLDPKIEKDDRLYLKIHDRSRSGGGKAADRVQMYRAIGLQLVMVAATAWTDVEDDAAAIHQIGQDVLLSAKLSKPGAKPAGPTPAAAAKKPPSKAKPAKPTVFAKAKIKVMPPSSWTEEKTDAAEGMVATYRDPDHDASVISVTVQTLPKETRKDAKARTIAIEEIVNGAQDALKVEGGKKIGETETMDEAGFLKKTRTKYEASGGIKFQVDSRMVLVGDAVVTVTSLAGAEDAEAVRQVGDQLALSITATGGR